MTLQEFLLSETTRELFQRAVEDVEKMNRRTHGFEPIYFGYTQTTVAVVNYKYN